MTIKDIAKECGCAVGTVSRVMNNHPDVSEQMREKVLAIVAKYNFAVNANAKQLKAQNQKTIVIFVKGTSSILLNGMLERIQKKMENLPYTASVVVLDECENEAKTANRVYYEKKPLGAIFLGGSPDLYREDFKKLLIPCVLISNETEIIEGVNLSSISTDNFKAAEFSANYLIQNGHSNIGVIGGALGGSGMTQRRYDGFLAAMENAGLSFDFEKNYVTSKYSFEDGAYAAKRLIEKYPDMTAIFTMSDAMAIGACRQLQDMGYKVPEDISVIGFDGIPLTEYYCPRLTTIRQKDKTMVDAGLDILLNSIERNAEPVNEFIPFDFIQGESVKKIN